MNVEVGGRGSGRAAKLLALASVGGFWALPISPLVAMGAVSMTRGASGWPRRLAVAGAVLCVAYTTMMALALARLAWGVAGPF